MASNQVCVHCGWEEALHANDGDRELAYVPLPGALFSLLDCPDYEPDLTGEVLREKSLRAAFEARLSEQW